MARNAIRTYGVKKKEKKITNDHQQRPVFCQIFQFDSIHHFEPLADRPVITSFHFIFSFLPTCLINDRATETS